MLFRHVMLTTNLHTLLQAEVLLLPRNHQRHEMLECLLQGTI